MDRRELFRGVVKGVMLSATGGVAFAGEVVRQHSSSFDKTDNPSAPGAATHPYPKGTDASLFQIGRGAVNVKDFGARGDGSADDTEALQTAINAVYAQKGGTVYIPNGIYRCTRTLRVFEGITLLGAGRASVGPAATELVFSAVPKTSPAIRGTGVSDVTLKELYLTGREIGSANEIQFDGNCRRISIENIVVNSKTTGAGIALGPTGYTINSKIVGVVCVGMTTGFLVGTSCTSISLSETYANVCRGSGYILKGTYLSLNGTASDGNFYGYEINGVAIALNGCGAEQNKRSAIILSGASGVVVNAFRSVSNNVTGGAIFGSFANVNDGSRSLAFLCCVDTNPSLGTINSVSSTSGVPGVDISFPSSIFTLPFTAAVTNTLNVANAAQAFVLFDGTEATPTIMKAHNVSRVTKNGVGDYTLHFTHALPGANFITTVSCAPEAGGNGVSGGSVASSTSTVRVTLKVGMRFCDSGLINVIVLGA